MTDVNEWDWEKLRDGHKSGKISKLKSHETQSLFAAIEDGLLMRFVVKLASTVEAELSDVHLRIEDAITGPGPVAVGVKIRSVKVDAAVASDVGVADEDHGKLIMKRVKVEGMSLYIDDLEPLDLEVRASVKMT